KAQSEEAVAAPAEPAEVQDDPKKAAVAAAIARAKARKAQSEEAVAAPAEPAEVQDDPKKAAVAAAIARAKARKAQQQAEKNQSEENE
ncbi:electron transport complex subunit RsxC, partial [Vibrio navarrensis]